MVETMSTAYGEMISGLSTNKECDGETFLYNTVRSKNNMTEERTNEERRVGRATVKTIIAQCSGYESNIGREEQSIRERAYGWPMKAPLYD